jgi:hypothetical protein
VRFPSIGTLVLTSSRSPLFVLFYNASRSLKGKSIGSTLGFSSLGLIGRFATAAVSDAVEMFSFINLGYMISFTLSFG